MYAIYGNIYHQYTPVMLVYIPYMDPMGTCTYGWFSQWAAASFLGFQSAAGGAPLKVLDLPGMMLDPMW